MQIQCYHDIGALEPHAGTWDRLAGGVPFRSWPWLSTWWRHYGPLPCAAARRRRLHVLCVFDGAGAPVALAPLYSEEAATTGRVLHLLGSGQVCSEYLGVLAMPGREEAVAAVLADYLADRCHAPRSNAERWDLIQLEAVDVNDPVLRPLLENLRQRGVGVHHRSGPGCWRIDLPNSWDAMLASLSRNHRTRIRRVLRRGEARRCMLHVVERASDLPTAFEHLVELHQRRWQSRGEPGAFGSEPFLAFHRDVTPRLLSAGHLQLVWIEADGRPLAAEYLLAGSGAVYQYQGGMDADRLQWEPGHLAIAHIMQLAIRQGRRKFDFLRGNEPYKAQWRAEFHNNTEVRIVASRPGPRMRHQAWLATRTAKDWARRGLQLTGIRRAGAGHPQ